MAAVLLDMLAHGLAELWKPVLKYDDDLTIYAHDDEQIGVLDRTGKRIIKYNVKERN